MGHLYVLKLRGNKWYVGYTDRSSVDRILEHIEKKGAKWTKAHPPLKKGYLHNFTTPGKTREDEDKYTLRLMKQHGIENVRGGKWCMVKMRKKTFRELQGLIEKPNKKPSSKKEKTPKSKKKKTFLWKQLYMSIQKKQFPLSRNFAKHIRNRWRIYLPVLVRFQSVPRLIFYPELRSIVMTLHIIFVNCMGVTCR